MESLYVVDPGTTIEHVERFFFTNEYQPVSSSIQLPVSSPLSSLVGSDSKAHANRHLKKVDYYIKYDECQLSLFISFYL